MARLPTSIRMDQDVWAAAEAALATLWDAPQPVMVTVAVGRRQTRTGAMEAFLRALVDATGPGVDE